MIVWCIIISTLFIEDTALCFQPVASSTNHIQGRSPRRALRTYPTREPETTSVKDFDVGQQHSIDNGGYDRVEPMKVADEAVDNDELVYHTDYHGVTTHPAPTPKHPGHSL
ncbi:hypothetical protein vseg_000342 [Gypsophila vaccaria]